MHLLTDLSPFSGEHLNPAQLLYIYIYIYISLRHPRHGEKLLCSSVEQRFGNRINRLPVKLRCLGIKTCCPSQVCAGQMEFAKRRREKLLWR